VFVDTLLTGLGLVDQTRIIEFYIYLSAFKVQNLKVIIWLWTWKRWRSLRPTEFPLRISYERCPQKSQESLRKSKCTNPSECSRRF
jgi:hypothetical protein